MTVYRNNPESEFWRGVDKSAAEVSKWPDWMIDRPRSKAEPYEVLDSPREANQPSRT